MNRDFLIVSIGLITIFSAVAQVSCEPQIAPVPNSDLGLTTAPNSAQTQGWRTNGTISMIDTNTLIIITDQGQIELNVRSDIMVEKIINSNISDFRLDQFVLISGSQDATGDISANSVLIRLAGGSTPPNMPDRTASNPGRTMKQLQGIGGAITGIGGNTLTINTGHGQVKIIINSDTKITRTASGSISDLHPGMAIRLFGSQDINGGINVTFISVRPPS
jgi:hypothetical protein